MNDARSLFDSLLLRLPTRWVNGWSAFQSHQAKPAQLAEVAALGVPVPRTLISNDPEAVLEFARSTGPCIFKPVQGGAHARRLTAEHLEPGNLQRLVYAPVTLQEEVPGMNIRAFVAGQRVLTCEIHTSELDYRDDPRPNLLVHEPPAQFEALCLRLTKALGLLWAGLDFRLDAQGRYVFLESNPSPMFLGFEEATGLALTESLAAVLTGSD
jgi:glutathione synthase/RimK-type ligase-like ATP-grasp enzyme